MNFINYFIRNKIQHIIILLTLNLIGVYHLLNTLIYYPTKEIGVLFGITIYQIVPIAVFWTFSLFIMLFLSLPNYIKKSLMKYKDLIYKIKYFIVLISLLFPILVIMTSTYIRVISPCSNLTDLERSSELHCNLCNGLIKCNQLLSNN